MTPKEYREQFTEAIEAAEKLMPDLPLLLMATAVMPSDEGGLDFPCAVGGRHLNKMESDPAELLSSVLRTVFELCLELTSNDADEATQMFLRAMQMGFHLEINNIERVVGDATQPKVNREDEIMKRMLKSIQEMF